MSGHLPKKSSKWLFPSLCLFVLVMLAAVYQYRLIHTDALLTKKNRDTLNEISNNVSNQHSNLIEQNKTIADLQNQINYLSEELERFRSILSDPAVSLETGSDLRSSDLKEDEASSLQPFEEGEISNIYDEGLVGEAGYLTELLHSENRDEVWAEERERAIFTSMSHFEVEDTSINDIQVTCGTSFCKLEFHVFEDEDQGHLTLTEKEEWKSFKSELGISEVDQRVMYTSDEQGGFRVSQFIARDHSIKILKMPPN